MEEIKETNTDKEKELTCMESYENLDGAAMLDIVRQTQDEVFDTIKAVLYANDGAGMPLAKAHEIFYDLDHVSLHTIFREYTGSLFMERYRKYQKAEDRRKKLAEQAEITRSIEFLNSKGYIVCPPRSEEDES